MMNVRRLFPVVRSLGRRFQSTLAPLEPVGAVAPAVRVLRMSKPPVNSLSLEMLDSLVASLSEAEADPECRGVILASAQPVFSAGLDIEEMYQPEPARLRQFWTAVQEVWLRFASSELATVAAIEGHSPAGGCLLALACDWRVMSAGTKGKPFTIGLNETKLGIVAPFWFRDGFASVIGSRQADIMLQVGALAPGDEALRIGLVDELVAHEEVVASAARKLGELLSVPDNARHASKMLTRQPLLDRLLASREADTATFEGLVYTDKVQKDLGNYIAALKARKK